MLRAILFFILLLGEESTGAAQTTTNAAPTAPRLLRFEISGAKRTRPRILTREIGARVGDALHPDSLVAYAVRDSVRLQNLQMFTDVAVRYAPDSGAGGIVGYISVKERWYIWPEVSLALADRNFNVWWTEHGRDLRRANLRLSVTDFNFRGLHETLRIGAQAGYTERIGADYVRPFLDKKQRHGGGISIVHQRSAQTFYTTDSNKLRFAGRPGSGEHLLEETAIALSYTYRPGYAGKHTAEIKWRAYRVADTVVEVRPDFFGSGPRLRFVEALYRYERRATDNWIYPLTGAGFSTWALLRLGLLGLKHQAAVGAEWSAYRRLVGPVYGALNVRGRLSVPEAPPYFLRSALGSGRDYLRGYEYYVIDGTHFAMARTSIKWQALDKTIRGIPFRYLPTLPIALYPKVFADGGWVHSRVAANSFLNNRPLASVGFGVDVVTAYSVILRLEWAWNGLGERGFFFHPEAE